MFKRTYVLTIMDAYQKTRVGEAVARPHVCGCMVITVWFWVKPTKVMESVGEALKKNYSSTCYLSDFRRL